MQIAAPTTPQLSPQTLQNSVLTSCLLHLQIGCEKKHHSGAVYFQLERRITLSKVGDEIISPVLKNVKTERVVIAQLMIDDHALW